MYARLKLSATPRAVTTIGLLLLLAGGALLVRSVLLNRSWLTSTDFGVYLRAASLIQHGHNPYDPTGYRDMSALGRYLYPPLLAEVLGPLLNLLGLWPIRVLWVALCATAFGTSVSLLLRSLCIPTERVAWPWVWLVLGLFSCTYLVRDDLYHGEANFFLLFFVVMGLRSLSLGHAARSGVWWGLACGLKPVCAMLVLWLLWRRQWRAAAALLATAALVGGGSFLIIAGLGGAVSLVRDYQAVTTSLLQGYPNNLALHGLVLRLFSNTPSAVPWVVAPQLVLVVDALLAVALAGICVRALGWARPGTALTSGSPSDDPTRLLLESGLVLAAGMALGPLTEGDHLLLLLPGLVAVVRIALRAQKTPDILRSAWTWAAAAWFAVFASVLGPLTLMNFAGDTVNHLVGLRPGGLAVLWTARTAVLLVALVLLTARALRAGALARNDLI